MNSLVRATFSTELKKNNIVCKTSLERKKLQNITNKKYNTNEGFFSIFFVK